MWAHVVNAALGIWLMAAPGVFSYANSSAATVDRLVGPVIATFAIVSWWEHTRMVGRWNVPLGLWLVVSPWILGYASTAATVNDMICGLVVAGCALVIGTYRPERFGGGWGALWKTGGEALHERRDRAGEVEGRSPAGTEERRNG